MKISSIATIILIFLLSASCADCEEMADILVSISLLSMKKRSRLPVVAKLAGGRAKTA